MKLLQRLVASHGFKNDAVIKLGIQPDVACRCARRKHCDLEDVAEFSAPDDADTKTVSRERYAGNQLRQHLDIAGFKEDKDYFVGTEPVALRTTDGGRVIVDAPYMLMTLRAARGLVAPR